MLNTIWNNTSQLIEDNWIKVVVFGGLALFVYSVYFVTTYSLRKLKPEILNTYPFDLFFPSETKWSAGYFLLVVIFLGAMVYFLIKGDLYLSPA